MLGLGLGIDDLAERQLLNTISEYNPISALGNVALWLRADLGVTMSGSSVSSWADQSGVGDAGRNFNSVLANIPYTATNSLYNNQPTMGDFSTVGRAFRSGVWSQTFSTYTVIVYGHSQATSNRYFATQTDANYSSVINGAGILKILYGAGGTTGPQASDGPNGVPKLMIGEFNGASSKIFLDAVITASGTGTTAGSTIGSLAYTLGSYQGVNATFGVEAIAEVLVLNGAWSALTTTQKQEFAAYINLRYNKNITA